MCSRNVARRGSPIAPLAHDPREQRLAGREAELGAEHVHDARPFGRGEQRARLGRVARERLLAEHVLARRARLRARAAACVCGGVAIVTASTPGMRERVGEARARVRDLEASARAPPSCRDRGRRARAPRSRRRAARGRASGTRTRCRRRADADVASRAGSRPRSRPSTASCTDRRRTGSRPVRRGRSARRARPTSRRRRRGRACSSSAARSSARSASVHAPSSIGRRDRARSRRRSDPPRARVLGVLDPFELGAAVRRGAQRQQLVIAVREHAVQRERGRPAEERAQAGRAGARAPPSCAAGSRPGGAINGNRAANVGAELVGRGTGIRTSWAIGMLLVGSVERPRCRNPRRLGAAIRPFVTRGRGRAPSPRRCRSPADVRRAR